MQTDQPTLRDLMTRLCMAGEHPPRKLLTAIRERGSEAVPSLIAIVDQYPGDDPDAPDRKYWATYHAIQLLGDLRAADAVEPILALLDEDDDYVDQYLPECLGQIGRPAIEPLREALFAPNADVFGVARAANGLVRLAERSPEHRPEIVAMLLERFEADVPNEEPETVRGFLVSDLADLRAVEAIPAVRHAYGANLVDETIIDQQTFRLIVERPAQMTANQALRPALRASAQIPPPGGLAPDLLTGPDELAPGSGGPLQLGRKVGRNEPCPCGSGTKYKRCHGR